MSQLAPPKTDDQIRGYLDGLGVDGMIDLHMHFMPDNVQFAERQGRAGNRFPHRSAIISEQSS